MYPIHRILVAIKDPQAKSLPAVAKAAQLAHAFDAELQLFHAIAEPLFVDTLGREAADIAEVEGQRRDAYRERLEAIAKPLRRRGLAVATAVEWDFPIHEAVIRGAAQFEADLIIAECHPTRHRVPWLLRFTDWELLRCSPLPVLLIKSKAAYRRPKILAAVDPGHTFAKPTNLDGEILRYASTMAGALRGGLSAVHAYDLAASAVGLTAQEFAVPAVQKRLRKAALERGRKLLDATLSKARLPHARHYLVGRHPIDAILEVAERSGCGIVVMGAVSRSGLQRMFIGNTAEKLLDRLGCDVLIVKPRLFKNRIARARRGAQLVAMAWDPAAV